ncbi:NAD-dependent succinate-semialdehyde dehydrogenase [Rhodococcus sp. NPDC057297]|uniref:NAD-dependent succinate-semialdehyde dehydrogenase n=1 Tax=Rhodococcus sp. NPDC057297 TaxID=3346090 RepID=UPI0036323E8A
MTTGADTRASGVADEGNTMFRTTVSETTVSKTTDSETADSETAVSETAASVLPVPDRCYVGGKWIEADSGDTIAVLDPGNGELVGTVPALGRSETRRAVEAAASALDDWRNTTAAGRAAVLMRMHDLMLDHTDSLARLLTREQGKPLAEAVAEIRSGAGFLEFYAEEGKRTYGDVIPTDRTDRRIVVIRQPVGVVAAITPWNFPSSMILRKIAPALAAGCTIVVKPAELTPLSALILGYVADLAGLPPGVLNVVTGEPDVVGEVLVASDLVRKLTFTGSTETGRHLIRESADTLKRVSMELGGNAPFIVLDDADLDLAVDGAVATKFRNAGQTCISANRIYVQSGIYEQFVDRLAARAAQMKVGHGLAPATEVGPLIGDEAIAKVESLLADAVGSGARVVTGGSRHPQGGLYFEPTVVADLADTTSLGSTEIFGPVAPVYRFDTVDEVVRLANATEHGLAAYIYTENYRRGWLMAEALEYGMVGVNEAALATAVAPFGGIKASGFGREGSRHGIVDYTELKYICVGGMS